MEDPNTLEDLPLFHCAFVGDDLLPFYQREKFLISVNTIQMECYDTVWFFILCFFYSALYFVRLFPFITHSNNNEQIRLHFVY